MKKLSRKKLCFFASAGSENCFRTNSIKGFSELALLIFTAVFVVGSVAFVSLKFSGKNNSGEGLLGRASGAIIKTLENIFSAPDKKPVLEIDLGKNGVVAEKNAQRVSAQEKIPGTEIKNYAPENSSSPVIVQQDTSASSSLESEKESVNKITDCDFSKTETQNHQIIFSEVNWAGSKESPNDEWIEIKNNSGKDISLGGWQILSSDDNIKIILTDKDKIAVGGFYLLERTDDNSAAGADADAIYSGTLSNSGTAIKIFSNDCSVSDEIDASDKWPAGDTSARKTMERSYLDFSWHTSANAGGTPKTENSAAFSKKEPYISFAAPGGIQDGSMDNSQTENQIGSSSSNSYIPSPNAYILISEVMAGSNTDSSYEFVEFYNPNDQAAYLTDWSVKKRSSSGSESTLLTKSYLDGIIVQPHSYLLIANASATIAVAPDVAWPKSYTLAYTQNAIVLYDPNGSKIDEVAWSDIPKNESYVRDSWNNNSFHLSATPTPQNSTSQ